MAFAKRHIAPGVTFKRHEAAVPELTPFFIVDEFRIPCLGREVKLEQTAAFARRLHRRHGRALATLCANEFHQKPPSIKLFQFSFCPFCAVLERHPSRRKASLWPKFNFCATSSIEPFTRNTPRRSMNSSIRRRASRESRSPHASSCTIRSTKSATKSWTPCSGSSRAILCGIVAIDADVDRCLPLGGSPGNNDAK